MIYIKKNQKKNFFRFFSYVRTVKKIFFFRFFQNFQNFFLKNGPRGPKKFEKKQSHEIRAYLEHSQRRHA